MKVSFAVATFVFNALATAEGYVVAPPTQTKFQVNRHLPNSLSYTSQGSCTPPTTTTALAHSLASETSSLLISAEETWRQYVPLAVSCGVIVDILLGSPLANAVMAPMRPGAQDEEEVNPNSTTNPNERVDTNQVAKAALDRANNSMELRRYLDENKSDQQIYEDMRKNLERQTEKLDENLDSFEKKLKE